jgi:hypothetical protein
VLSSFVSTTNGRLRNGHHVEVGIEAVRVAARASTAASLVRGSWSSRPLTTSSVMTAPSAASPEVEGEFEAVGERARHRRVVAVLFGHGVIDAVEGDGRERREADRTADLKRRVDQAGGESGFALAAEIVGGSGDDTTIAIPSPAPQTRDGPSTSDT